MIRRLENPGSHVEAANADLLTDVAACANRGLITPLDLPELLADLAGRGQLREPERLTRCGRCDAFFVRWAYLDYHPTARCQRCWEKLVRVKKMRRIEKQRTTRGAYARRMRARRF